MERLAQTTARVAALTTTSNLQQDNGNSAGGNKFHAASLLGVTVARAQMSCRHTDASARAASFRRITRHASDAAIVDGCVQLSEEALNVAAHINAVSPAVSPWRSHALPWLGIQVPPWRSAGWSSHTRELIRSACYRLDRILCESLPWLLLASSSPADGLLMPLSDSLPAL